MSQEQEGTKAADGDSGDDTIVATVLRLTDTLTDDYGLVGQLDLLAGAATRLVGGAAAVVLLDDQQGRLAVMASTSEKIRRLAVTELEQGHGPALQCMRSGRTVSLDDFSADQALWAQYLVAARDSGFQAALAVPLRLREEVIGVLEILYDIAPATTVPLQREAAFLAEAAAIGILHQRINRRVVELAEQLQHALNSRVVIEQAKGMLAERRQLSMDAAFEALRHHARSHNVKLNEIAAQVIARTLDPPPAPAR
ncbi:MAG TPA: GAF and ANTAR domain-containing protein [Mycobacteriales bacterium]|nr:GAF and ANTAR domain-containing protein [Mycobacteriales bacterium]